MRQLATWRLLLSPLTCAIALALAGCATPLTVRPLATVVDTVQIAAQSQVLPPTNPNEGGIHLLVHAPEDTGPVAFMRLAMYTNGALRQTTTLDYRSRRVEFVHLPAGEHTLVIAALDDAHRELGSFNHRIQVVAGHATVLPMQFQLAAGNWGPLWLHGNLDYAQSMQNILPILVDPGNDTSNASGVSITPPAPLVPEVSAPVLVPPGGFTAEPPLPSSDAAPEVITTEVPSGDSGDASSDSSSGDGS